MLTISLLDDAPRMHVNPKNPHACESPSTLLLDIAGDPPAILGEAFARRFFHGFQLELEQHNSLSVAFRTGPNRGVL